MTTTNKKICFKSDDNSKIANSLHTFSSNDQHNTITTVSFSLSFHRFQNPSLAPAPVQMDHEKNSAEGHRGGHRVQLTKK